MRLPELLNELKRRRVYRVSAAYVVAVFAALEAADLILPALLAPPWVYRALVILALAAFPLVVAVAWIFDLSPSGVHRTGPSPRPPSEQPAAGSEAGDAEAVPEPNAAGTGSPLASARPMGLPGWTGRPLLIGTVVVGLIGVGAWFAGRWSARAPSIDPSATLAILPFAPATEDPELLRIGRELVVTLSHSLAATAELDVAEPLAVLATIDPDDDKLSPDRTREVATSLGAAHIVQGALLREDDQLRLEMGLYDARTMQRLASDAVSGDRIEGITSAATVAVLRLIWADSLFSMPNPGPVTTRSAAALRGYLDGERAIAEGRWREAPEAFARAVAADSAFGPAYWRLQYALEYHGSPVDSVVIARAWEYRHELSEQDRILLEARSETVSERLRLLRDATTRFPTHWPTWWDLAEVRIHNGGYLGLTYSESRAALERTLSLNPRFVPAWSHLFWLASRDRDPEAMSRIIDELSSARYDRVSLAEVGINTLEYYRAQHALVAAGDAIPDEPIRAGVRELVSYRGPTPAEEMSSSLLRDGFLRAQIRLAREIQRSPEANASMARAQHYVLAHALAGSGMWDEAVRAAQEFAASALELSDLLVPYRIAVLGAWAEQLESEEAASRRPRLATRFTEDPDVLAEVRWLDGVLALARGDDPALSHARIQLAAGEGTWRDLLVGSLDAFQIALEGDSATAGSRLHDLELEWADEGLQFAFGETHPFLNGVNRLSAARWLLAAGDTLAARRLLPWHEVVLPSSAGSLRIANQVLATPALRVRADLAEAAGRERDATRFERLLRERRPFSEESQRLPLAPGAAQIEPHVPASS